MDADKRADKARGVSVGFAPWIAPTPPIRSRPEFQEPDTYEVTANEFAGRERLYDDLRIGPRWKANCERRVTHATHSQRGLCCTSQRAAASSATSLHCYGRRTYSGRPSSSIRFSALTAISTSVARR